jgi:extradiol dioxygenase family protein
LKTLSPFHLAIPVADIQQARQFYGGLFGCAEGRSASNWVDFDFFGHQLVVHLKPQAEPTGDDKYNNWVDGHDVPVPHFGIVLDWEDWETLAHRLTAAGVEFVIDPYVRFKGKVGEQATMFLLDPSGNAVEFKAFRNRNQLFAK